MHRRQRRKPSAASSQWPCEDMTSLTAIRRKVGLFGNFCCLVLFKSELYPPHLVAYAYLTRAAEKHTPPSSVLAACRRQDAVRRPRLGARIEARGRCCTTMIDLAALGSLFVDVFGISKEWSTPKWRRVRRGSNSYSTFRRKPHGSLPGFSSEPSLDLFPIIRRYRLRSHGHYVWA